MSEFSERLSGLMFENKLNRKEFAAKSGVNKTCITHYLQDKHVPTVENLVKIADFFQRSTDFLLGREEENSALQFNACPPFCERLKFLKEKHKLTDIEIYGDKRVKIAKSCYYEWLSGSHQPSLDNILCLAAFFDCRIDYLLGREK